MVRWSEFEAAQPDLAERVLRRLTEHRHHTMATIRANGAPRISGTEVEFVDGELVVGMMPGTRRAADLLRDPRVAIHSQGVDPPDDDPSAWPGEVKISGRAVEMPPSEGPDSPQRFRISVEEAVLTRIGDPADHLEIEAWSPDGGVRTLRR